MKVLAVSSIAALMATTLAAPTSQAYSGGQPSCAGDQVVSCCNQNGSNQALGGSLGLIGGILGPGTCLPISIPVVGASLTQLCGNNVAQCCNNNQVGLINLNFGQCVPIVF